MTMKVNTTPKKPFFPTAKFQQIPNDMIWWCINFADANCLLVYQFLWAACFNRQAGDWKTKFNVSTICKHLNLDKDVVLDCLRKLVGSNHAKLINKQETNEDLFVCLELCTFTQHGKLVWKKNT